MSSPASAREALRFEFAAAGCMLLGETTAVIHVRGRWRGPEQEELGDPELVVRDGAREVRLSRVRVPGNLPAVAGREPEPWAGMYALPRSFFRRAQTPELALETADGVFALPGGDEAWSRWASALASGERPRLVELAPVAAPSPAPRARLELEAGPVARLRPVRTGDPLVSAGVGLVVVAIALTALPILAARPAFGPVFAGLAALVALVVRKPEWLLPAFIGLTWAAIPGGFFGGLPSPVEGLGLLLLGVALWRALRRIELAREVMLVGALIALPAIASWALAASEGAQTPVDAMKELIFLPIVAFGLVRLADVEKAANTLTVTGTILGAGALYSVLVGEIPLFELEVDPFGVEAPRAAGPFGESNFFALSLAMIVPIALYVTVRSVWWRMLGAGTVVLLFGAIIATGSRGGLLAAFTGLLATGLAAGTFGARARQVRLAAVVAVLGVGLLAPQLTSQIQSSSERAVSGRATENLVAIAMFADHVVTGVGPERYPALYRDYTRRIGDDARVERYPHSLPLQIAAEQGLAGLLGWLAAILVVGLYAVRRRVWDVPVGRAVIVAILVYGVGSLFLHGSTVRMLYVLVGMVFAIGAATAPTRADVRGGPA